MSYLTNTQVEIHVGAIIWRTVEKQGKRTIHGALQVISCRTVVIDANPLTNWYNTRKVKKLTKKDFEIVHIITCVRLS